MTQRNLSERDAARAKLKASVDTLAEKANLQVQMQKEPLKMLGGATGVGLALGVLVGRSLRRSRRIYVDAASSKKEQKALMKAQSKKSGGGIGNVLVATMVTVGFKVLRDRVITPRLTEYADKMMEKNSQAQGGKAQSEQGRGTTANLAPKTVDLHKP